MLESESVGYLLFALNVFFGYSMLAALLVFIGMFLWIVAVRAEKKGKLIEVKDVGQTTYREPWVEKLFAIILFAFGAFLIGVGILS